jgi:integrase
MNTGQTNVSPEKHGNWWTIRVWDKATGSHPRKRICPISGPDALDKIGRQKKAAEILAAANSGEALPSAKADAIQPGSTLTVKMAGDSFLHQSMTRRRKPIRQNTARIYAHYLNRWIYPVVGETPLSGFKSMQAKQVIDAMHGARASTSVINDVITIMQQIIESVRDSDGQPVYNVKLNRDVMDAPEVKSRETKAFTADQIEQIIERADGQYKVLFALLGSLGTRIGEALAIEIDAKPETTTTISRDCRVLYVNTIILQDGTKQDAPKTVAGVREIDVHPDMAAMLQELIGNRTKGLLFCTDSGKPILYSNLRKNVVDPILYGYERKKMAREGKGWKCVGVEKHPGVLPEKAQEEAGYGFHSFRRFRATHLAVEGCPSIFTTYWLGHGKKTITEEYEKAKQETKKRRELCEKIGVGFKLGGKIEVVETKTTKRKAA